MRDSTRRCPLSLLFGWPLQFTARFAVRPPVPWLGMPASISRITATAEQIRPGGGIPALKSVAFHERGLHTLEMVWCAQTLDRRDRITVMHDSERQAGINTRVVDQHRTRTALPMITSLPGAGELQLLTQGSSSVTRVSMSSFCAVPFTEIEPRIVCTALTRLSTCVMAGCDIGIERLAMSGRALERAPMTPAQTRRARAHVSLALHPASFAFSFLQ